MPSRQIRTGLLTLILTGVLIPLAVAQNLLGGPPPLIPPGTPAPAFKTTTLTGQTLTLKSLHGKVVLLDYWATWCGPCRMATPTLEALHKKFAHQGLRMVGLSLDDPGTVSQVKPVMRRLGITYTISASPVANHLAAGAYRVNGIPSQYLIDKDGLVRWSQSGFSPDEGSELDRMIQTLLAEKG